MTFPVVLSLILGLSLATLTWACWPRRRCPRCPTHPVLRDVKGAPLEACLTPMQRTEHRIGATHVELLACPACRATRLDVRPVPGVFVTCRKCSALAARQRHVTLIEPTPHRTGRQETRAACEHCHAIDVTVTTLARTTPARRAPARQLRWSGSPYGEAALCEDPWIPVSGHGHAGVHDDRFHGPDACFDAAAGTGEADEYDGAPHSCDPDPGAPDSDDSDDSSSDCSDSSGD